MIKEVIVVEGKDDIAAVKAAIDAEVIQTHGYAYGQSLIDTLRSIGKRRGLIILTDPDYMGNKIRKDISGKIPNSKHAFLPKGKALKKDNVGVENATPEDIRIAILNAKPEKDVKRNEFSNMDMIHYGLTGDKNSTALREKLCAKLGIGYGNSKNLVSKLNSFGITREELEKSLEEIYNEK